jgi:hypothetical protein
VIVVGRGKGREGERKRCTHEGGRKEMDKSLYKTHTYIKNEERIRASAHTKKEA